MQAAQSAIPEPVIRRIDIEVEKRLGAAKKLFPDNSIKQYAWIRQQILEDVPAEEQDSVGMQCGHYFFCLYSNHS